jgi:hypothetical protein
VTDLDKYLFDLRGYIVVEDVLSTDEVAEMNGLIDEHYDEVEMVESRKHQGGFLPWGQPFVDLLDHERILPLLKFILGDGFRLDHYYAIYADSGAAELNLHGSNTP